MAAGQNGYVIVLDGYIESWGETESLAYECANNTAAQYGETAMWFGKDIPTRDTQWHRYLIDQELCASPVRY